jgi:hypothetical protein
MNVQGSLPAFSERAASVVVGRPTSTPFARQLRQSDDAGMTTAEYAVGTVAACGFAGILYKLLTSDSVQKLLMDVIERALTAVF